MDVSTEKDGDMSDRALRVLAEVAAGRISPAVALEQLALLPLEEVSNNGDASGIFARLDHNRALRQGQVEVVYGEGKTLAQLLEIARRFERRGDAMLATRVGADALAALQEAFPAGSANDLARTFVMPGADSLRPRVRGSVLVVTAGTGDLPVAEEAAVTADVLGNPVERLYDVGVAGIHRVLSRVDTLRSASVVIVVAGMEGALPSVVGGLVRTPVIAVPTSVGYGASFQGIAALLGMLNSCAAGVAVVNIDNGFGAACAATRINVIPPAARSGGEANSRAHPLRSPDSI
jgi:pyridinium-3,5-biscarboxylic acid mononucleotide synthase